MYLTDLLNTETKTEQVVWEAATIWPCPLQVDLLTLKVVSESL